MKRLTKEQLKQYCNKDDLTNAELCMVKELLEYKDIENELGVDLITLFKALKNGIHKKDYLDCCYDCKLRFMKDEWYLAQPFDENYSHIVRTKDYGKTWLLLEK